jgi:hypothetical protein
MSKKHVQHKVTYCCDQGLSFFTAELNEAVDAGIQAGIEYEREANHLTAASELIEEQ